ncbi:hypothetical protein [Draconibacterium orientale]|uniref:hypothetical protein n=1 Tax=Draconibacterium orientale TaxID=1168034 RepID=UPI002A0A4B7F|nr:hypothetical protein [Draconibacterium orientale]
MLNDQCLNQLQLVRLTCSALGIDYYTTAIALTDDAITCRGFAPKMIYQNPFAVLFSYNCRLFVYNVYNVEYPMLNDQCLNQLQLVRLTCSALGIDYYTTAIALTDDAITCRGFTPGTIYWKPFVVLLPTTVGFSFITSIM